MNIKIVGIVVGIIAIVTIICTVAYFAIEDKWFTPWDDDNGITDISGSWGEKVVITYTDGSTDSLKMLIDRPWPLDVYYEGKQITEIWYYMYASAIGEGYTTCNIDLSSLIIEETISPIGHLYTFNIGDYWLDQTCYLPLDGVEITLGSDGLDIDSILSEGFEGGYTITFTPTGSVKYRGENGGTGEWVTADLPVGVSISVDNVLGWVYLDLTSTIDAN